MQQNKGHLSANWTSEPMTYSYVGWKGRYMRDFSDIEE
jgi:hypothetical protein